MEDEWELVCDGAISNDFEWSLTQISKARIYANFFEIR